MYQNNVDNETSDSWNEASGSRFVTKKEYKNINFKYEI